MGSMVGQGEHDSQLLRILEDTDENKCIMIRFDGVKFKVCRHNHGQIAKKHPMLSLAIFAAERTSYLFAVFDSPTI